MALGVLLDIWESCSQRRDQLRRSTAASDLFSNDPTGQA